MKYLIPVLVGGATITVAVITALAQAHGAFIGHTPLTPYLCGYGVAAIFLVIASILAVNAHKQEGTTQPFRALFVLEVEGSQPLDTKLSDWKILLTNCCMRTVTYVQLGPLRSEIGAYEIFFKEIPVMIPNQKTAVEYEVIPRREDERHKRQRATLWDFGMDHAGERGHTYIWYDIPVRYRDADNSARNADAVSVCFDLAQKILKTEGVEYWKDQKKSSSLL